MSCSCARQRQAASPGADSTYGQPSPRCAGGYSMHANQTNRRWTLMAFATLVLISAVLAVLAGAEVQPAQASLLARKTPTPTATTRATGTPAATPTNAGTPTPTPLPGPNGTWSVVPSPNTGSPNNYLLGVAAIASND